MATLRNISLIIVFLFCVGCGVLDISPVPLSVTITSPQEGASVTSSVDFSFSVTGDMPNSFKPVVVIKDPLGQLWPWLHVENHGQGNWFLPGLTLGNVSDCGQSFELHVVITNDNVPPSRIDVLPNGEHDSVTVTRVC